MSRCHERSSKTAEEGGKKPEEEQEEGTTTTRVGELFRWTSYHAQYRKIVMQNIKFRTIKQL